MKLIFNKVITARKIAIILLLSSTFISGYMPFVKFEVMGVTINLFRIILLALMLYCFFIVIKDKMAIKKSITFPNSLLLYFFSSLVLLGVIHILLGNIYADGISEIVGIGICFLFFLILSLLIGNNFELWRFSINAVKIIGILVAIMSIFELIFGFKTEASRFNGMVFLEGCNYHPATSVFVNENNLAAFLLIVCTIVVIQIIKSKDKRTIIKNYIELIILNIPLAAADSTIFRLGIMLVVIVSIGLSVMVIKNKKELLIKAIVVMSNVILVTFVLKKTIRLLFIKLNLFINDSVINSNILDSLARGDTMLEQIQYGDIGTVEARKNLFLISFDISKEHPFIGRGSASFSDIFSNNDFFLYYTGGISNPHNLVAEIMVQYGILMALFLIIICCYIIIKSFVGIRSERVSMDTRWRYVTVIVFVIAFAVTTIMPSGFIDTPIYYLPLFLAANGCYVGKKLKFINTGR